MSKGLKTRWSQEEEKLMIRTACAFPQNLSKCFLLVSETIGRTPGAVCAHWYSVTSKQPEALCFFTASPRNVSKNRKNGVGISTTENIWRKFMRIINTFVRE